VTETEHSVQPTPIAFGSIRIRDHPTAPRSPWQNGHVERLIGSIRRESLDHLIVFGETHLRHFLKAYASYYNEVRIAH
jgi:transposase InsO family protein